MGEKVVGIVSRMDSRDKVASILSDLYDLTPNITVDLVKVGNGRKAYRLVCLFPYDWDNMTAISDDQVLHPEKFQISKGEDKKEKIREALKKEIKAKLGGGSCELAKRARIDRSKFPPITLDWNTKSCSGDGDCIYCQVGCSNRGKNIVIMEVFAETVGYALPEERSAFLYFLGQGGYIGTKRPVFRQG